MIQILIKKVVRIKLKYSFTKKNRKNQETTIARQINILLKNMKIKLMKIFYIPSSNLFVKNCHRKKSYNYKIDFNWY